MRKSIHILFLKYFFGKWILQFYITSMWIICLYTKKLYSPTRRVEYLHTYSQAHIIRMHRVVVLVATRCSQVHLVSFKTFALHFSLQWVSRGNCMWIYLKIKIRVYPLGHITYVYAVKCIHLMTCAICSREMWRGLLVVTSIGKYANIYSVVIPSSYIPSYIWKWHGQHININIIYMQNCSHSLRKWKFLVGVLIARTLFIIEFSTNRN